MDKISVNNDKIQIKTDTYKNYYQDNILEIVSTKNSLRKKLRKNSCDLSNTGLKQFLPKNMLFCPIARPSEAKLLGKNIETRCILKELEGKLKETLKKFTSKKISNLKRETQSLETERVYSALLVLFSEVDPSINTKGLKINPKEVMMNYISNPNKVLKTLQDIIYNLNSSKISEKILYTSYSIYLNIAPELLGLSKILYHFLSDVFNYCGMSDAHSENLETDKIEVTQCEYNKNSVQKPFITENHFIPCTSVFKPSSLEVEMGVLLTRTTEKPPNTQTSYKKPNFEVDTGSEETSDINPPRISQKYLNLKSTNRSLSLNSLKLRNKPKFKSD